MLIFTGDTHNDKSRFDAMALQGEGEWGRGDTLLIGGDFCYQRATPEESAFLDELAKKPYLICFCDGNHDNFDALGLFPVEEWNGGLIHRLRHNVIHLMRGQVYEIEGKTLFTMGGAYSLDKAVKMYEGQWWAEELPCDAEYREATRNLSRHGMRVDYILTHTAPTEIIRRMGFFPDMHDAELTGFLEWIMYEVSFDKWFFGHLHKECCFDGKLFGLYYDTAIIGENGLIRYDKAGNRREHIEGVYR